MSSLQHVAELISLGMTMPTLVLSASVVYFWGASLKSPRSANEWFITGVVFGFLGSFLDNTYWLFPWTASFFEMEEKEALVNAGVYFNIFFRQGLGIFAAYCHLKAAELHENNRFKFLNKTLVFSSLAGVFYALFMICLLQGR